MGRRGIILGVALAVAAAGVTVAFTAGVGRHRGTPLDRGPVIATVDGVAIHAYEAEKRLASLGSVHGTEQPADTPAWRRQVVRSLADDVLVREEAARQHISITPSDVERGVAGVRRMFASDDAFAAWLDRQGMDLRELDRRVELQLLWTQVRLRVVRHVGVSDADVEGYYRDHAADFTTDGRLAPLFEVKASITETLRTEKQDRAFTDWLAARRTAADVVVLAKEWGGPR